MGDIPTNRVQPSDYVDPFLVKEKGTTNTPKDKVYIPLFVCFSTKVVHLELVGDLTKKFFTSLHLGKITSPKFTATMALGAERETLRSKEFQNKIINTLSAS